MDVHRFPGLRALYKPLPNNDWIRVLIISPAPKGRLPISCRMGTIRIDTGLHDALSYSWGMNADGDAALSHTILINVHTVAVTQNLFEGLLRIRDELCPIPLWVDAVCINQDDVTERNAQVARMADIYSHAGTVRVWLGEGRTEAEDVEMFQFLSRVATHFGMSNDDYDDFY
jgi:hypothetical protein